jgi:hypothetical protein
MSDSLALRLAAAWRLNGLLLERPRAGWREEVDALAAEVEDGDLRAAAAAARHGTEGEYLAHLGPGGPVSPREVAYRDREDPARVLADLAACYEAFAYRPRAEDPADHIAVEAGFVGYLLLKELIARDLCESILVSTVSLARERFLHEHVGPFARALAARLEGAGGHLELAARALAARATEQAHAV